MLEQDIQDALVRLYSAENPWAELMLWLEERRALNLKLGGNDDAFMTMLVYLTLINALPAAQEGRT